MQVPVQIRFHNMAASEAIETKVRERVARLERFSDGIISCRVTIEAPHRQPHKSTLGITVGIGVRGREIVVKRELRHHEARDDAYQVIGVAFDAAERQLEEHARMQRRTIKSHDGPIYARVALLYPEQSYGFIETPGRLNVYFHRVVVEDDALRSSAGRQRGHVRARRARGPDGAAGEPGTAAARGSFRALRRRHCRTVSELS
jgi:ribosomal subunit interface protein